LAPPRIPSWPSTCSSGPSTNFGPDRIARQVPELNKLLALREALVALKGPLGNVPAFRKQLQHLLNNEQARKQLAQELDLVLEAPEQD